MDNSQIPAFVAESAIDRAVRLFPGSRSNDIRQHFESVRNILSEMSGEDLTAMDMRGLPFLIPADLWHSELMASVEVLGRRIDYPEKDDFGKGRMIDPKPRRAVLISSLNMRDLAGEFNFMAVDKSFVECLPDDCLTLTETLAVLLDKPRKVIDAGNLYTSTRIREKATEKEVGFMGVRWISDGMTQHTVLFVQDSFERPEYPWRCLCGTRHEL